MIASRFFTPEPPSPLGLDLADLTGGGSCPARFEGRCFDQRLISVRYRDGCLSVALSASKETLHDPANEVLSAQVGPALHGDMSLHQACALAGLTVRGNLPTPEGNETDLSGATSFFQIWQGATAPTATEWVLAEMSGKPMVTIDWDGERRVDETETLGGLMVLGLGDDISTESMIAQLRPEGAAIAPIGQVFLNLSFSGWGRALPAVTKPVATRLETVLGRRIIIAGQTEDCPVGTLALSASFATDDLQARAQVEALSDHFDAKFPPLRLRAEDLSTGKPSPIHDLTMSVDPLIAQWVAAQKDRYVSVQYVAEGQTKVPIGWRPGE